MTEEYALVEGVRSEGGLLILGNGASVPDTLSARRELAQRAASGFGLTGWGSNGEDVRVEVMGDEDPLDESYTVVELDSQERGA